MHVPFLDLPAHNRSIWPEIQARLNPVLTNAEFILGPAVEKFESDFAAFLGAKYCVGLNNGTSALHMALLASGIGPGDEVITTPATWISTSWAISYVGASPIFVDIDPVTYTLDPDLVEHAITRRTKAILPVHLYGQCADMTRLIQVADRHGLVLLEDAAQAHGARHHGRSAGTLGKAGCFSFYPGKNLGAFGEGGCVVTDDSSIAQRIRQLRDHAQNGRHHHVELGFNTRMEGVQAAVLAAKLPHLNEWNQRRRLHATTYAKHLRDVDGLTIPRAPEPDGHVWHLYSVMIHGRDREEVREALREQGITTAIHYPTPVPFQPAYCHLGYKRGDFPVAEQLMACCISLPMYPELRSDQVEFAAQMLRDVMAKGSA